MEEHPCVTPVKYRLTRCARRQQQMAAVSHEATMADSLQVTLINRTAAKLHPTPCRGPKKTSGKIGGLLLFLLHGVVEMI